MAQKQKMIAFIYISYSEDVDFIVFFKEIWQYLWNLQADSLWLSYLTCVNLFLESLEVKALVSTVYVQEWSTQYYLY